MRLFKLLPALLAASLMVTCAARVLLALIERRPRIVQDELQS